MRSRAFTLVEMLVVVAVVGILIGILLPTLGGARESARTAVCVSNMRQLGVAHGLFMQANDGQIIDVGLSHGGVGNASGAWVNTLQRYLGDPLNVRCPEDRSPHFLPDEITQYDVDNGDFGGATPVPGSTDRFRRTSYGANNLISDSAGLDQQTSDLRTYFNNIDRIRRPAAIVAFFELAETGEFAGSDHAHVEQWSLPGVPVPPTFAISQALRNAELHQHGGVPRKGLRGVDAVRDQATPAPSDDVLSLFFDARSNYAFLDGSVRTAEFQEVYTDVERNLFDPSLQ
ncbi:MAG: type II secretion system protein [Phycisphaerales bacterium]|nr:MAG: type II secretion system protein [Phycisphaerales bacterium]